MSKVMVTVVLDQDVYDELCTYPDHRVKFLSDPADVTDDIFSNSGDRDKPMKPIRSHFKGCHSDYYHCPICNAYVGQGPRNAKTIPNDIFNYCVHCGQKMDKEA